jgi:glycosyltransferase involved in cell wall biosynthesis
VIASNLGAMTELIEDGKTGALFPPGDADHLSRTVSRLASDAATLGRMRLEARREFERTYTAEANYRSLLGLYARAIETRTAAAHGKTAQRVGSRDDRG